MDVSICEDRCNNSLNECQINIDKITKNRIDTSNIEQSNELNNKRYQLISNIKELSYEKKTKKKYH